ncbi:hypothetical protein KDA00_05680 [Candidatus Saccharibacteria bacterium]|nr:hypothetical protein [Candidatus Saccharibacteria bacterium]
MTQTINQKLWVQLENTEHLHPHNTMITRQLLLDLNERSKQQELALRAIMDALSKIVFLTQPTEGGTQ